MGRPLFTPQYSAPTVVVPDDEPVAYPPYSKWTYENSFDPDSDEFFVDAIDERPLLPGELPVLSDSGSSSASSSGRGTPAQPASDDIAGTTSPVFRIPDPSLFGYVSRGSGDPPPALAPDSPIAPPYPYTQAMRRRSASDAGRAALEPSAMVTHYTSLYNTASQHALQRMEARQRGRSILGMQRPDLDTPAPALAPVSDSDNDEDDDAPAPAARVHTSDITPIPLPSSVAHARTRFGREPPPVRRATPPQPLTAEEQSALFRQLSPTPPPGAPPRVYEWPRQPGSAQTVISATPPPPPGVHARPRWPFA